MPILVNKTWKCSAQKINSSLWVSVNTSKDWDHSSYSKRQKSMKAEWSILVPNRKPRAVKTEEGVFPKRQVSKTANWAKDPPHSSLLNFAKRGLTKAGGITTCCLTSNHQFIEPMLFCTCWVTAPHRTPPWKTGSWAVQKRLQCVVAHATYQMFMPRLRFIWQFYTFGHDIIKCFDS